jgi:hypothetical protein
MTDEHRRAGPTARATLEQLLRIAFAKDGDRVEMDEPFHGRTPVQVCAWVERQPPAFHQELTLALWRQPDAQVRVVKELRTLATDRHVSAARRRRASRLLTTYGWDDASLQSSRSGC